MESELGRRIQVALSSVGARMFRNNVALAWVGLKLSKPLRDGSIVIRNPRPLHAGLCDGSSDYIGWKSVEITQDMVGRKAAIFCAVEVKTSTGKTTEAQNNFIEAVNEAGGIAFVARSEEEAKNNIEHWRTRV